MDEMNCEYFATLLDAYLDGALDVMTEKLCDRHLERCAGCQARLEARRIPIEAVRGQASRHRAPAGLEERLLAALPEAPPPPRRSFAWWQAGAWGASAAALAASLFLTLAGPASRNDWTVDLVGAHARSLQPDHLTDVLSSDRHTVKPWFNGRLDFAPEVPDLAADGFPLIGGRLDYVEDHTAAALVYKRRQHVINLFVWAVPGQPDSPLKIGSRNGYHLLRWVDQGIAHAAVSDLAEDELEQFQRLWRQR